MYNDSFIHLIKYKTHYPIYLSNNNAEIYDDKNKQNATMNDAEVKEDVT